MARAESPSGSVEGNERRALLKGVPAFSRLPEGTLEELAGLLNEERFPAGGVVVAEGEVGDRLYLISSGHAEVSAEGSNGPVPLAALGHDGYPPRSMEQKGYLLGGFGNDTIYGGAGEDSIYGGRDILGQDLKDKGNDILYGQTGRDDIEGDEGADVVYGGADDDAIRGGEGADGLYGNGGSDSVFAGGQAEDRGDPVDRLYGGSGPDFLYVEPVGREDGPDVLYGDSGSDTLYLSFYTDAPASKDIGDCGSGVDTAYADSADVLYNCEKVYR